MDPEINLKNVCPYRQIRSDIKEEEGVYQIRLSWYKNWVKNDKVEEWYEKMLHRMYKWKPEDLLIIGKPKDWLE